MYALADCNSFFASCEALFRPELKSQPIVILSNNDGNVIARSYAAKSLGIKMGEPWFQLKNRQFSQKIHAFSSNYTLYHSLSQRVMSAIEEFSPYVEQYSIDEMFIEIKGLDRALMYEDFGRQLREHVKKVTGLTIGIGMGPTKTLAKSSQWATKEWPQFGGVLALTVDNPLRTEKLLSRQPVTEVWGIGGRLGKKLNAVGITTALQLARANPSLIRKNFSVVVERTARELAGESCIDFGDLPPPKQQILCSRSFGERVTTFEELRQAVCKHAERAAEKLRLEGQYCRHVSAFIKTSPFAQSEPYYGNSTSEKLSVSTQDTRDIISAATRCLGRIWKDGHRYAKAGVMLGDFSPLGITQLNLFDEYPPRPDSAELMAVLDKINNSRLGKVWFAGQGISPSWQMKRDMLSPSWTTRWEDIPVAQLK